MSQHSEHAGNEIDNDPYGNNSYIEHLHYIPPPPKESPEPVSSPSPSTPSLVVPHLPQSSGVKRASSSIVLRNIIIGIALIVFILSGLVLWNMTANTMAMSQQHVMDTATADIVLLRAKSEATIGAATAIAQATATVYAAQNPYPAFTNPFLDDPLTTNKDQTEWYVGDDGEDHGQAIGTCSFTSGGYELVERYVTGPDGDPYFNTCTSQKISLTDFVIQVEMKVIKGDCGGIAFHNDDKGFYYAQVCQDGNYGITRFKYNTPPHQQNLDLAGGSSLVIKKGLTQVNQIAVAVHGQTFDLYVNRKKIASAQNSDYKQGLIGFVAMAQQSAVTDILYNNAQIWIPSLQDSQLRV